MIWTTSKVITAVVAGCVVSSAGTYGAVKQYSTVEVREVREIVASSLAPTNELLNEHDLVLDAIKAELEKQTALLTAEFAREEAVRMERQKRHRIDVPSTTKW